MILSDVNLRDLLPNLLDPCDEKLINPASIDIRIGSRLILETEYGFLEQSLAYTSESIPYMFPAKGFALVSTYERLIVPNGYAVELKLKSSIARRGFNHSLAFWFDPGWDGIGTMEIHNLLRFTALPIWYGMKFAQIIVHRLTQEAKNPYQGRYQNASSVEKEKPELLK